MASTVLASRNQSHQSFMGEIPNYSNNNPRHLNPNPNPSQKPKSNKKKHFPINGRLQNSHHAVDSCGVVVSQAASDDAYSFNQRPIETVSTAGFNQGGFVTYNVSSCSRSEINELRKKLVSDLERIRNLNDRIQTGELIPRTTNGKFKKLSGNKRMPVFGSSNSKEGKNFRQGSVNNGEIDGSLMKSCRQVLTKLMKHKLSWVFNKPVDAVALGLHDYHQIIKRPMDLGTVKSNLSKGFYANPVDFASDVRLVFENAMLYNPRTDEVHRMAEQLLTYFEDLFRPIQAKLASHNHNHNQNQNQNFHPVNEFSAVDELDGSSWDDIPTPDRSKKMKTSVPVDVPVPFPFVSSKQNHSTASNPNPIIPPPVVVQSPIRTPSPMQPVPAEPVKPSSTTTRGTYAKLPKPRAKDPNKREMNMDEKQRLGLGLQSLPPEKMPQLLQIIRKRNDRLAQEGDEIELDIEALDTETLWELDRFVTNWKKAESKAKRQALLVNTSSAVVPAAPSVSVDIDDIQMPVSERADVLKKSKKEAGEEDVDIGDEMPESSFPHVEIERDEGGLGGGGPGQVAVHENENAAADNASSSSSGSSSSSSGDSSSSSDSDSGSSSGSDSDADDAQS
ncbi:transcription factor GTE7-like [Rutidosis leptorrhynchoides]|uniref:transcription factor GTE7-like n=1 Tax=Rutidosis leptorrhynchoides TaxID=125765 RepID=UPI003A98F542